MIDAAQSALDPQRNGAIVYLGDGVATVGEAELPALRARLARMTPRPRLYAVAVGEAPRLDVLSGITQARGFRGCASCSGRRWPARRRSWWPTRRGPSCGTFASTSGPPSSGCTPPRASTCPRANPSSCWGASRGPSPRTATVRASWQGREVVRTVPVSARLVEDRNDLRYRWATARLDHLLAEGEPRMVVVELGTRYGLITPYTSLFVPGEDQFPAYGQRMQTAPAEPFSVFDLIPLVGCSRRSLEGLAGESAPAPVAASTPTSTVTASTEAPSSGQTAQNNRAPSPPAEPSADPAAAEPAPESAAEEMPPPPPVVDQPAQAAPAPVAVAVPMAQAAQPMPPAAAPMPIGSLGASGGGGAPRPTRGEEGQMGGRFAQRRARASTTTDTRGPQERLHRDGMFNGLDVDEGGSGARATTDDNERTVQREVDDRLQANARRLGPRGNSPDTSEPGARVLLRCSDAAAVSLAERIPLWRERVAARPHPAGAVAIWRDARARCELPAWADRVAMLRVVTVATARGRPAARAVPHPARHRRAAVGARPRAAQPRALGRARTRRRLRPRAPRQRHAHRGPRAGDDARGAAQRVASARAALR
jgi:hypothetical protein